MKLNRQFTKATGGMSIGIFMLAAVVILLLQIYATTLTDGQTVGVIFATAALVIGFLKITRHRTPPHEEGEHG